MNYRMSDSAPLYALIILVLGASIPAIALAVIITVLL
jgi:hypothetical protein